MTPLTKPHPTPERMAEIRAAVGTVAGGGSMTGELLDKVDALEAELERRNDQARAFAITLNAAVDAEHHRFDELVGLLREERDLQPECDCSRCERIVAALAKFDSGGT